jgi:Ca2+-binding EF-hand superfamily protein
MKLFQALLFTALLLLIPVTPASAEESVGAFDTNGDGRITFEEVMKRLEKSARPAFDSMDRNHDGVLSGDDFDDVREGMEKLERWFDELLKPFLPENQPERIEV